MGYKPYFVVKGDEFLKGIGPIGQWTPKLVWAAAYKDAQTAGRIADAVNGEVKYIDEYSFTDKISQEVNEFTVLAISAIQHYKHRQN